MNNMEIFKDIKGYVGLYKISNKGKVVNAKNERERKAFVNKWGYKRIVLSKKGETKNFSVHRLVAQTFIPNPHQLSQVNHKDENKLNNCVENLEWCTSKYNNNYGTRKERMVKNTNYKKRSENTDYAKIVSKRKGKINYPEIMKKRKEKMDYKEIAEKHDYKYISECARKKLSKNIYQYDENKKLIKIWKSSVECQQSGLYDRGAICKCCRGVIPKYKNYIWSYKPLERNV